MGGKRWAFNHLCAWSFVQRDVVENRVWGGSPRPRARAPGMHTQGQAWLRPPELVSLCRRVEAAGTLQRTQVPAAPAGEWCSEGGRPLPCWMGSVFCRKGAGLCLGNPFTVRLYPSCGRGKWPEDQVHSKTGTSGKVQGHWRGQLVTFSGDSPHLSPLCVGTTSIEAITTYHSPWF